MQKQIFDLEHAPTNIEEKNKLEKRLKLLINEVLTDKQKQYLVDYYFNGLKQYEIAEKYAVAPSTVCRGINGAKARLGIKAYWLDYFYMM